MKARSYSPREARVSHDSSQWRMNCAAELPETASAMS